MKYKDLIQVLQLIIEELDRDPYKSIQLSEYDLEELVALIRKALELD